MTASGSVALTGIIGGNPDLYVYDSSLQKIAQSTNDGWASEVIGLSAGTYYAMVHIWATSGSTRWHIYWSESSPPPPDPPPPDPPPPDDPPPPGGGGGGGGIWDPGIYPYGPYHELPVVPPDRH